MAPLGRPGVATVLLLIEVVRREYKVSYEDRDPADKQVSALPGR